MRNKNVGVGVANTNSIVKDVTKFIIKVMINDELEYDWIIRYWLHNISDTLFGAKVVKLTEDNKEIRKLEDGCGVDYSDVITDLKWNRMTLENRLRTLKGA